MSKKILVTGGLGYIGSHTVVQLQQQGYEVIVIDDLSNSRIEVADWILSITGVKPTVYLADCSDFSACNRVFSDHKFDGVIHFAACKAVNESVQDPLKYYNNNLKSLLNILTCCDIFEVSSVVFSSSCTVYGEPDSSPVTEMTCRKPAISPYGYTKQVCEDIMIDCISKTKKYGLKGVILRYFNPIGAHPSGLIGELPNGVPQNLVPYITQTAAGIRKELSIFGNDYPTHDGTCIRDFIDVNDLAKAHIKSLEYLEDKPKGFIDTFNLGTGRGVSVLELVNEFIDVTGVKLPYKFVDRRPGDIIAIYANADKANSILGWKAEIPLRDTLLNAWNWQITLKYLIQGI